MLEALRIALVGDWPPPHGGLSVHVAALARHLEARGADVRVLDVGRGDHAGRNVRPARGIRRYAAALADVAGEGRLVHVHTNGANAKSWLVAIAGGRARRPSSPRGVLTIHSGLCPAWLAASPRRRDVAAWACAAYARVVAVSEEIAGALAAAGVPARRIAILSPFSPSMLAPGAPPPGLVAFRAARAPLFAAALAPGRIHGADVLAAAFARVRARDPGAGLVAFGPGTEALAGEGILALGDVPHGAALAVIAAADVLVRPTRADGDAVSVREALALGTGVVATAVGHRPPGCLLVAPGDAAALAVA
ncbi:MAG TPA: glycosyltransferase, partial [Anaeromyxobacter sp.]